ncbi:response regulator transcription factor [Actinomycetospora sp. NBC_00405]|uniref:response regulator transcription factor n=1 Tax=Actinomycetospora sp. NBC_00405 TaxID=2975952 RepID=UPI002E1F422C
MTIRVLIADDHEAVRTGLVMILSAAADIEVVGEAGDGDAAIRRARDLRPDVVLMDVRMPSTDGIAATRELTSDGVCAVLVLTTFDHDEYVFAALRAGAAGFLLKSADAARLVDGVRRVAAGEGVLEPGITPRVIAAAVTAEPAAEAPPGIGDLTDREREVFAVLGEGLSNHEIGRRLRLSEATVKTHVSRVLAKLDLRSRTQAAIVASRLSRP